MAEEAEGMNAVESDHEVTAGAKAGQAEGDRQTANLGKADDKKKLNEVNSLITNTGLLLSFNLHSILTLSKGQMMKLVNPSGR